MNVKACLNFLISLCIVIYILITIDLIEGYERCLSAINLGSFVLIISEVFFTYLKHYYKQSYRQSTELHHWKPHGVLLTIFQVIACFLAIHILLVLFGSPVLQDIEATATLSFLLTSLVCCRTFISEGPYALKALFSAKRSWSTSETEVRSILIFGGAWLGAVFIPLDWDRPWQTYPITCCLGAFLGEAASDLYFSF